VTRVPGGTPASLAALLELPEPTAEQAAVISAPLTRGLVVAGAGSGKTETMAGRVVYLVATRQLVPGEVLGLTFTRKAAGELSDRVTRRLDELFRLDRELAETVGTDDRRPTVSTYDAFAAEVVADHGLRLGVEPGARLLRPAQAWQLADRVVRAWEGGFTGYAPAVSTAIDVVRGLHDQLAAHCLELSDLRTHLEGLCGQLAALPPAPPKLKRDGRPAARQPSTKLVDEFLERQVARLELLELVERYRELLTEAGSVDFASVAAIAARLARDVPEVAAAQRATRRLVLLDEFQDTSPAQLVLVSGAFADIAVTAVGDPHQSIYGWRGAGSDTLGSFAAAGPRATATATLSTSFRNAPQVLDVANAVARPLQHRTRVEVPTLVARADAADGLVAVALHRTLAEELLAVTARARDSVDAGASVAVLVRTRRQIEPLLATMRDGGLPVEVVGLAGLLGVPVVVEVVSVLRVLAEPDRGDALVRVLTGARWRIGPRDLDALAALARSMRGRPGLGAEDDADEPADPRLLRRGEEPEPNIVDALDRLADSPDAGRFSPVGRRRLVALAGELRELRGRTHAPLGEIVADVVSTTGLAVELAVAAGGATAGGGAVGGGAVGGAAVGGGSSGGGAAGGAAADLAAFTDEAERYASAGPGDRGDRDRAALSAFLAYLEVAEDRERGLDRAPDPDPEPESVPETVQVRRGRVQLLTVHAAKGLEWDVVCVPGMVEEVFPAKARVPKGWITDLAALPHDLRADRTGLPELELAGVVDRGDLRRALEEHDGQMEQLREAEERRLAYVAVTRARRVLSLSGHRWGTTKKPREPSRFLSQLRETAVSHQGRPGWDVGVWAEDAGDEPDPASGASARWPGPLLDPARAAAVEAGAALVSEERRALLAAEPVALFPIEQAGGGGAAAETTGGGAAAETTAGGATAETTGGDADELRWADDVDLLVAERERLVPGRGGLPVTVELPGVVTVSGLVALARDPDRYALALRRPLPREPRVAARLGTRFHAWLEQRWDAQRLLDVEDLPGSADDVTALGPVLDDEALRDLQDAFSRSSWALRTPAEVEFAFAMPVGADLVVRGRVDAVFTDAPDGSVEVLDWKTGPPPRGDRALREVAVQLAAYRLAWHRRTGTPLHRISGAFHHVGAGVTVRPADLLDEDGLLGLVSGLPAAGVSGLPAAGVSGLPAAGRG